MPHSQIPLKSTIDFEIEETVTEMRHHQGLVAVLKKKIERLKERKDREARRCIDEAKR